MSHLTREELSRFWAGEPAGRERVIAHLAECDACGALYGEVVDAEPPPPPATVPRGLVARGRRAYRRQNRAPGARWSRAVVPLAAAAAVVLVAVLLRPMPLWEEEREIPAGSGLRGAGVEAVEPSGETPPSFSFRWSTAIRPQGWSVEVREAGSGRLVLRAPGSGDAGAAAEAGAGGQLEPSPDELAQFAPGVAYEWRVVALDAAGEALTESAWRRFVVVAAPP